MRRLILDSGAVTFLSDQSPDAIAVLRRLRAREIWPPLIPSVVLVECLTGNAGRDAKVNRFPPARNPRVELPMELARRAATLRTKALASMVRADRKALPSAVDALVVAYAEAEGSALVLTGDGKDLRPLAEQARGVRVATLGELVGRTQV
ncbi:hypothetical protein Ppa06_17750 [Planomonospora parontospora subsp. parontospora]|uniref:PIN domain-containing protein n=2 Tax=Planomonospora parontospora TaxID=58119 RepID=A0AA37BER8_9ACTN|nr:hypothetical protein GCM10010126_18310 [Planomonospora parontospora]GII07977.1 hypothetical protein Ppa06_17750 [Planomonospora parontospora subsp. parontospora]